MKKEQITVERLKALVAEYARKENEPYGHPVEWAYVMLEPDLIASREITLEFLKQMSKEEFDVMLNFFLDVMKKFKSAEFLSIIESHYLKYYGENKETEAYIENIDGLEAEVSKE